jgi:hypothetical protein
MRCVFNEEIAECELFCNNYFIYVKLSSLIHFKVGEASHHANKITLYCLKKILDSITHTVMLVVAPVASYKNITTYCTRIISLLAAVKLHRYTRQATIYLWRQVWTGGTRYYNYYRYPFRSSLLLN